MPAEHADIYEEVAPSFWRNLVTVPIQCLENIDTGVNLPSVPDSQKDKQRAYQDPIEASKDKPNKDEQTDEQTKSAKKQTHVPNGDYELATKNTGLDHANKYDDSKPSKVKGLEKAKELNESFENIYYKMLTEDVGVAGQVNPTAPDAGDQLAGNPQIQSEVGDVVDDTRKMTIEKFLAKYMDQVEEQEEILVRNDPTLQNEEATEQAANIVADKLGIEIVPEGGEEQKELPAPEEMKEMSNDDLLSTLREAYNGGKGQKQLLTLNQQLRQSEPELCNRIGELLKAAIKKSGSEQ
jgi:hypothetical protein